MTASRREMTQEQETSTMKWIVELEGGEAFPHNAAVACKLAANGRLVPETGEVFQRLAAALATARTAPEPDQIDAIAGLEVHVATSGPAAGKVLAESMADAIIEALEGLE